MTKEYHGWNEKEDDSRTRKVTKWRLVRTYKLQKCKITGKLILPLSMAYKKTYYHYYNGKVAFSDWLTIETYTFEMLKGGDRLRYDL